MTDTWIVGRVNVWLETELEVDSGRGNAWTVPYMPAYIRALPQRIRQQGVSKAVSSGHDREPY